MDLMSPRKLQRNFDFNFPKEGGEAEQTIQGKENKNCNLMTLIEFLLEYIAIFDFITDLVVGV